jgi:hypothetical protein
MSRGAYRGPCARATLHATTVASVASHATREPPRGNACRKRKANECKSLEGKLTVDAVGSVASVASNETRATARPKTCRVGALSPELVAE